jgi:hypothetical protein
MSVKTRVRTTPVAARVIHRFITKRPSVFPVQLFLFIKSRKREVKEKLMNESTKPISATPGLCCRLLLIDKAIAKDKTYI